MKKKILCLIYLALFVPLSGYAEAVDDIDMQVDDLLYGEDSKAIEQPQKVKVNPLKLKELSELRFLAPFEDVAIIQKKYLAKTERFELFPNLGVILNDAFFVNQVLAVRAAYHFTEKWSLELNAHSLSQSAKKVTKDLDDLGVETSSIVVPKSFFGADVKWTPYYGKMAFLDGDIVPFETYLSLGMGSIKTNQTQKPVALHAGLGQQFAMNKSLALRWDTSFYWYNAKTEKGGSSLYTNIHFTIGASFFFPEARYR